MTTKVASDAKPWRYLLLGMLIAIATCALVAVSCVSVRNGFPYEGEIVREGIVVAQDWIGAGNKRTRGWIIEFEDEFGKSVRVKRSIDYSAFDPNMGRRIEVAYPPGRSSEARPIERWSHAVFTFFMMIVFGLIGVAFTWAAFDEAKKGFSKRRLRNS